jgi:hypothetical protein
MATIPDGVKAPTPKPSAPKPAETKPWSNTPAKDSLSGQGGGEAKTLKDINFRLGFLTVAIILLVAACVDGLQWLMTAIIIGEFGPNILLGGVMGWFGFPLIYYFIPKEPVVIYGFSKDEVARIVTTAVSSTIEMLPLFDNLPAIILGQIIIILTIYAQDIINSGLLTKEFMNNALGPVGRVALKIGSALSGQKKALSEATS